MTQLVDATTHYLRFARSGNWWFSKIPPLLAVAYLTIALLEIDFTRGALLLACYLFSVSCAATYGHIINDIFDVNSDRRAGKHNAMAEWNWSTRTGLCLTVLCAGFLPALIVPYPACALLLLALNYVWPTIYSLPAIRLKERGILGVVCDVLGSHVTPTLLALAIFQDEGRAALGGHAGFPLIITLWSSVLGIKGILHHQIADRDNDIASGTATFAAKAKPESMTRFLAWFNLWIEAPVSGAVVIVVYSWCQLAIAAYATYCILETAKYGLGFQFSPSTDRRNVRANIPFANEMFYVLWLPLAAAVQLAVRDSAWLCLPLLHVAIFYKTFAMQLRDLDSIYWAFWNSTKPYRRRFFSRRK
jgi:4-hydroxybenzoate polyprenyltransferase